MLKRWTLTLALLLPTSLAAGPRQDWQPIVDALHQLGPVGQVDYADQLEQALAALGDADLEALGDGADLNELAEMILISADAKRNAEDALVAADVAVVESLARQGFELPADFSVRRLIEQSALPDEGIWSVIQAHARPAGAGDVFVPRSAAATHGPTLPPARSEPLHAAGWPTADGGYPSAGFPVLCVNSPNRTDSDTMIVTTNAIAIARNAVVVARVVTEITRTALETAKIVWNGVDRLCKQTAVVLGNGGNTSLACVPADVVLAVLEAIQGGAQILVGVAGDVVNIAEDVVRHINACDAAIADAELEASYKRLDHLHGQLGSHEQALSQHDLNIDQDLIDHDANIDADLSTHDAHIEAELTAHDAHIDADLSAHDALMSEEHERLLRTLQAQQIEIVLTSGTPPPHFAMPGGPSEDPADWPDDPTCPGLAPAGLDAVYPAGGFERVRCITWGSIDRMTALGHDTHVALRHFESGERDWMTGAPDYRSAVQHYAKAMSALMTPGSAPR